MVCAITWPVIIGTISSLTALPLTACGEPSAKSSIFIRCWSNKHTCEDKYVCYSSTVEACRKYSRQIRELIARKRYLWRHFKHDSNNEAHANRYKTIAKKCKTVIRDFR